MTLRSLALSLGVVLAAALPAAGSPASAAGTGGTSPAGGTGGAVPVLQPGVVPGGEPDRPVRPRRRTPRGRTSTPLDVPRSYARLYRAAGRRYGVDWLLLAAIGKNESDHGRSTAAGVRDGLNFARCCAGPMQICVVAACGNPWASYAADGNGDGRRSVYDPADSIFAAAALVRDLRTALGRGSKLLLAGYNAGAGAVQRHDGVPPYAETRAYVGRGLTYIRLLRAG